MSYYKSRKARWYPPSGMADSTSEDNENVLNFESQRLSRQPDSVIIENIKGDKTLIKIKTKKKKQTITQNDIIEYNDVLQTPRYDQSEFQGPSYGHPDFFSRMAMKLNLIAKRI